MARNVYKNIPRCIRRKIKIVEVVEYVEGTHQIIEEVIRIRAIVFACSLY